jgi:hypothetical protein
MGDAVTHSTNTAEGQRVCNNRTQVGFAAWCQTEAPHALNLNPDIVDFVCRLMQRPEMHGITRHRSSGNDAACQSHQVHVPDRARMEQRDAEWARDVVGACDEQHEKIGK